MTINNGIQIEWILIKQGHLDKAGLFYKDIQTKQVWIKKYIQTKQVNIEKDIQTKHMTINNVIQKKWILI